MGKLQPFGSIDEYHRYLRCWRQYLDQIERDRDFTDRLRQEIDHPDAIISWPRIWPEVLLLLFGNNRDRFVTAVEKAANIPGCGT